ncbi:MAG: 50S ribosomal protein L3 [Acidobacteria bacterium]|nr:50S ribosomal protein L3 [Acidobacteriota bacterium]MBI3657617.1 50S ribosomal protein L3 [Acidobacteriota bacterium]
MTNGLIGIKLGMTQIFLEDGSVVPVTVLKAGPCVVVQRKTKLNDGYEAAQIGLVESRRIKKPTKPMEGHFQRGNVPPTRILREFGLRTAAGEDLKVGDPVLATHVFQINDRVDVIGTSKGLGFAGVVRRHHFRGGPKSHGSMFHRAPGSIGASSYPSRVLKGMRMAGHAGNARVTVRNLQVVMINEEQHLVSVRGAVPGKPGGYVIIRRKSL